MQRSTAHESKVSAQGHNARMLANIWKQRLTLSCTFTMALSTSTCYLHSPKKIPLCQFHQCVLFQRAVSDACPCNCTQKTQVTCVTTLCIWGEHVKLVIDSLYEVSSSLHWIVIHSSVLSCVPFKHKLSVSKATYLLPLFNSTKVPFLKWSTLIWCRVCSL